MRDVPSDMVLTWLSGEFIGDRRPMARVTVQRPRMQLHQTGDNIFASWLFGENQNVPRELPNVLKVDWERDVESTVNSATVELLNTHPLPLGTTPPSSDFDLLGHYTPQRGLTAFSSRWGHTINGWVNLLLPDNIIRIYEGYGFDDGVPPSSDPNLVQTGVWAIEDVELTADGRIVLSCVDPSGPLLNQQIAFPPVVPFRAGPKTTEFPSGKYAYPVQFQSVNPEPIIHRDVDVSLEIDEVPLTFDDSSNTPYISSPNALYRGHRGSEAFDDDDGSYWLSVGNARRDQGYSFEWIQGRCPSTSINTVAFRTRGSGYTAYIGVYADGAWQAGDKGGLVPYDPDHPASAPNFSDENYVMAVPVLSEDEVEVTLPREYENVTKVRVTFFNLWDSNLGQFQYRAAVRDVRAFTKTENTTTTTTVTRFDLKNYDDYTDIVKLFLAWAGFFWPEGAFELDVNAVQMARSWTTPDNCMTIDGAGRVWGDFKLTGTAGPLTLGIENFEKKPLIDCINYVADIVGFYLHIDETGGAVFRPPNVHRLGNWRRSLTRTNGTRTPDMPVIDERVTLEGLSAKLSSRSIRERTFVSNTDGTLGAMAKGFNPNPTGLRRVGGWTDQNFSTQAEVEMMADLIIIRQMFSYRGDTVTIRGNPQIQVDDQIRIYEGVTNEGYVHYVKSISSSNDLRSGEWSYDLETHWLGQRPFESWVFDEAQLGRETRAFIAGLYGTPEEAV